MLTCCRCRACTAVHLCGCFLLLLLLAHWRLWLSGAALNALRVSGLPRDPLRVQAEPWCVVCLRSPPVVCVCVCVCLRSPHDRRLQPAISCVPCPHTTPRSLWAVQQGVLLRRAGTQSLRCSIGPVFVPTKPRLALLAVRAWCTVIVCKSYVWAWGLFSGCGRGRSRLCCSQSSRVSHMQLCPALARCGGALLHG